MEKNKALKETLLHYINLEYYANGINNEFQALLKQLEKKCFKLIESFNTLKTKNEYTLLHKAIKEEVDKFEKELQSRLEEEAEIVMNEEVNFLDNLYNHGNGNDLLPVLGTIAVSRLLFAPIAGDDTLKQFTEKTGKNILRSYDNPLRSGYLFGQNTKDVTQQIANSLKQTERGMQNGIRTAIPSFAKTTDKIVFLNNNVEVTWVTTLDGNVCITCSALSGLRFKSVTEAPFTPHFGCRCALIPSGDLQEPIPDFEEFIESLSEEEQKHVLGANRYNLWKDYGVSLNQFTNNGTVVPLDNIKNSNVVISDKKIADYVLNPEKSNGKAEVFKSALGYTIDNYKELKENIFRNLNQENIEFLYEDNFGKRYRSDFEITGPNGKTKEIRVGLISKPNSDKLQLTTVYVR